ncbi:MAG: universal stress protein [Ferrimicrobium sp.]
MFDHFLVAVDSSTEASKVIEAAAGLARVMNATVEVLHVRESVADEFVIADLESEGEASLVAERHVQHLLAAGISANVVVASEIGRHAGTADVVVEVAKHHGVNLIIIGQSHHGALMRIVGGSVTAGVVRDAPCSLLLVHDAT